MCGPVRLRRSGRDRHMQPSARTHALTARLLAGGREQFSCLLHCFHEHILDVTICMGPSMLPTFNTDGDVVLVEFWTKKTNALKAGDVVVAKSPTNPKQTVCKRIAALEGQIVTVEPQNAFQQVRHHVVSQGHVWLQGDNLNNSTDSRSYGAVPLALVRGRVFYKMWPPSEMRRI
jgi:mitochondrial inner membrane protease subunit 1